MVQSGLGIPVPSVLLAGSLCWDSRAADFASLVLQLPWDPGKIWFMRKN